MYFRYQKGFSSGHRPKYVNSVDPIIIANGDLGGLYLGDFQAAQNYDYFKKNKISCVLTVAASASNLSYPSYVIDEHKVIAAEDHPYFQLDKFFTECFDFIHENRCKGRSVLVHCMAGISRSATIVIGYIMSLYEMDLDSAYEFVKKRRNVICPNEGFVQQLIDYNRALEAERKDREKECW